MQKILITYTFLEIKAKSHFALQFSECSTSLLRILIAQLCTKLSIKSVGVSSTQARPSPKVHSSFFMPAQVHCAQCNRSFFQVSNFPCWLTREHIATCHWIAASQQCALNTVRWKAAWPRRVDQVCLYTWHFNLGCKTTNVTKTPKSVHKLEYINP